MLTLLLTVLATAYFVVPALLTRYIFDFYFIRKASTGSKSEEILRAAFWASVPLALAWCTRHIGYWKVPQGSIVSAQKVFAALYSEKLFDSDPQGFYGAFRDLIHFNFLLLLRTYSIVILFATAFGWIAVRLGTVRAGLRSWPRLASLLHWAFMPRISEWHVALSPILLNERKELIVRIDVMMKNGILYRGNVFEKRLTAEGDLATLILKDAQRMMRDDFIRDRTSYEKNKTAHPNIAKPNTEDYWRKIPGELFLLNGSEIASVNVRHVRPVGVLKPAEDEGLSKALAELREQLDRHIEERQRTLQNNTIAHTRD
jgi:hypothetical protein